MVCVLTGDGDTRLWQKVGRAPLRPSLPFSVLQIPTMSQTTDRPEICLSILFFNAPCLSGSVSCLSDKFDTSIALPHVTQMPRRAQDIRPVTLERDIAVLDERCEDDIDVRHARVLCSQVSNPRT